MDLQAIINKYNLISLADRVSSLQEKYPQFADKIKFIASADPSGNQKYLDYAVKVLISGKALENEIVDVVNLFHKYQPRLTNKDINSYSNFTELRDLLFNLRDTVKTTKEKKEIKTAGAEKKYEDDQCVLLRVKEKAAACFYGSGTKWCITMNAHSYFENYDANNVVFYFLLRKDLDQNNPIYKVAFAVQRDENNQILQIDIFNAEDNQIGWVTGFTGLNGSTSTQIISIIHTEAPIVKKSILAKLSSPEINDIPIKDIEKLIKISDNQDDIIRIIFKNKNANIDIIKMIMNDYYDVSNIANYQMQDLLETCKLDDELTEIFLQKIPSNFQNSLIINPNLHNKYLELIFNSKTKLSIEDIFILSKSNASLNILNKALNEASSLEYVLHSCGPLLFAKNADEKFINKILDKLPAYFIYNTYTQNYSRASLLLNKILAKHYLDHQNKYGDSALSLIASASEIDEALFNLILSDNTRRLEHYTYPELLNNKNLPKEFKEKIKDWDTLLDYKESLTKQEAHLKNNLISQGKKKSKKEIPISIVKKLPYKSLNRMIEKAKAYLKKNDVMKDIFAKYNETVDIIDYIPTMFGELDVSAKTDKGVVILSYKLLADADFFKDYSYLIHEYTHWADQCLGSKPTQSSDDGNYLDNHHEQKAFTNQVEYIADHFGDEEAEKYVDNLLDHHDVKSKKEKSEKKEVLMSKV